MRSLFENLPQSAQDALMLKCHEFKVKNMWFMHIDLPEGGKIEIVREIRDDTDHWLYITMEDQREVRSVINFDRDTKECLECLPEIYKNRMNIGSIKIYNSILDYVADPVIHVENEPMCFVPLSAIDNHNVKRCVDALCTAYTSRNEPLMAVMKEIPLVRTKRLILYCMDNELIIGAVDMAKPGYNNEWYEEYLVGYPYPSPAGFTVVSKPMYPLIRADTQGRIVIFEVTEDDSVLAEFFSRDEGQAASEQDGESEDENSEIDREEEENKHPSKRNRLLT